MVKKKKLSPHMQLELFPCHPEPKGPVNPDDRISELEKKTEDAISSADPTIIPLYKRKISQEYLLSLDAYNVFLKQDWMDDKYLSNDNLLMREVFHGIKNSKTLPVEILDGLNTMEIALMYSGIYKRKFLFTYRMLTKQELHKDQIPIKRNLEKIASSRIEQGGHLSEDSSLYGIMDYLLNATKIGRLRKNYVNEWFQISETSNPEYAEKRYMKLNPYDPKTLKQRCDSIQRKCPEALKNFKEALAKPFIPERIVKRRNLFGNPTEIANPEGFLTPGKTYKRGVKGQAFYRLKDYAKEIAYHYTTLEQNRAVSL